MFRELNEMESAVLKLMLEGNHPSLQTLRQQLQAATVLSRTYTGVGFFTKFHVPDAAPRIKNHKNGSAINDVCAEIEGLKHPAGFNLLLLDGALSELECFIHENEYPQDAKMRRAYYIHPSAPGSAELREVTPRDLAWALRGFH